MYDVIVIGARCAGSVTGMLLARHGYRVLIVDRASFPSDTLCTHQLSVPAAAMLDSWGLLERVTATGCPVAYRSVTTLGASTVVVPNPVVAGVNMSLAPRRSVLDFVLIQAAREAGAEVREGFTVRDLVWAGDRVSGLVGQGAGGRSVCEFARVVVGADGRQSLVARAGEAEMYDEEPTTACCYYAYWRGIEGSEPTWQFRGETSIGLIPTNDDLTCIVVRRPVSEWVRFKREPEATYLAHVTRFQPLAERLKSASRHGRFVGTVDLAGLSRHPWGPGWALVGDAGRHHHDPLCQSGIADAFWQAARLARALDDALSGRKSFEGSLSEYHRDRDSVATSNTALGQRIRSGDARPAELASFVEAVQREAARPVERLLAGG